MAVAVVLSFLCAAVIAKGAAQLARCAARRRRPPDVGPAAVAAAGAACSFFVPTQAFPMASSPRDPAVVARKGNHPEAARDPVTGTLLGLLPAGPAVAHEAPYEPDAARPDRTPPPSGCAARSARSSRGSSTTPRSPMPRVCPASPR